MKEIYLSRLQEQLNIVGLYYKKISKSWQKTWKLRKQHDELYEKYIDLCILALLTRRCIELKITKNINVLVFDNKNEKKYFGLKSISDYFIHQVGGQYSYKSNKIYLHIYTDKRKEIKIDIVNFIKQIESIIHI